MSGQPKAVIIGRKLIKIYDDMGVLHSLWKDLWANASAYALPSKDDVYGIDVEAQEKSQLYDSSAEHFNELFATAFHTMQTGPSSPFIGLNTGDPEIDELPEVREYLQRLIKKMHLILNNSNFQAQMHDFYLDQGCFGTSPLRMEEDDEIVIRFTSQPISEVRIKNNAKGIADTVGYETEYTVLQAFDKFGEKAFGKFAKELAKNPDKKVKVVHLILPRHEVEMRKITPFNKPFASYHIYKEGKMVIKDSGFDEFPYAVARWKKTSRETYGRSCAMKALADTRMQNSMRKTTIRSAQKSTDPGYQVPDDGVMGRVNAKPGGVNPYRAGTKDRIEAMPAPGDPRLGLEMIQDNRSRLKEYWFIDQLQLKEGDRMTTLEVSTRNDDRLRLLGPIVGRQTDELLAPLVKRLLGIMRRKKLLPDKMPPILQKTQLQVFFTSQIAKAIKQVEGANVERWMASIAPVVEFRPEVADIVNVDEYARYMADVYSVPEKLINSTDDLERIRQERAEANRKAQEQQDALTNAEVVNKTANKGELKTGT